jgi:hypothetical protein
MPPFFDIEQPPMQPTVFPANLEDLKFIISLQKKFSNQIGFVPQPAIERYLASGLILRGDLNDQEAGYLLVRETPCQQPGCFSIVQAAVRLDAQRHSLGLKLVQTAEENALFSAGKMIQAACREDLEANRFWQASGFSLIAWRPGGKARAQRVLLWRKQLESSAQLNEFATPRYNLGANGRFVARAEMRGWNLVDQSTIDACGFEGSYFRHPTADNDLGDMGTTAQGTPGFVEKSS